MTGGLPFVIRDGVETDLLACMGLDHGYETEYVWQMSIAQGSGMTQVTFKTERLPRWLEGQHLSDERRLSLSLSAEHCFLIASHRDQGDTLGYLTMRHDPIRRIAWLQDLVVDRAYRGVGIGMRLLKIARGWANEREVRRITAELTTQNYPAISFFTARGFTFCGYNDQYFDQRDIAVFLGQALR
ncbi:MAG: GNAT family N-acetyltransferase [Anaerolineae bacterium]|jgi:GNAT superfamily N-acetyltransferase|nr:GNAT family N-acetyltransferase [Anaerolineae bacterium]